MVRKIVRQKPINNILCEGRENSCGIFRSARREGQTRKRDHRVPPPVVEPGVSSNHCFVHRPFRPVVLCLILYSLAGRGKPTLDDELVSCQCELLDDWMSRFGVSTTQQTPLTLFLIGEGNTAVHFHLCLGRQNKCVTGTWEQGNAEVARSV